ncbi:MAG: hypothetical protein WC483_01100 [Candidatus Paceibacterota bacterium]
MTSKDSSLGGGGKTAATAKPAASKPSSLPSVELEPSRASSDHDLSKIPPSLRPMVAMFYYRGYKEVVVSERKGYVLLHARGQTQIDHPRPDGDAIALIDATPSFSHSSLASTIHILLDEAKRSKLSASSSLIYIYSFKKTGTHSADIEKSYAHVLSDTGTTMGYYLESISMQLFQIDRSAPRESRKWRLHREDYFVLMYTRTGRPVTVDRPPTILYESEEILYIGGRPNDCVSFERLECIGTGPMWIGTMRKIGARMDSKTVESTSESHREGDD